MLILWNSRRSPLFLVKVRRAEQPYTSAEKLTLDGAPYLTRTSFMMRPEMFQSCTYKLPSLSQ